jgi:hypothetical protein
MSIDNVQARAEDGRIEVGLFEGEECREVIALRAPEAFELRDSLNDALREAGLLDRRTAASEQHAVGLLEVARDVVCARIETADPVRFYERMSMVAERAMKAVETVDHAPGRRLLPAEREALAARPWPEGTRGAQECPDQRMARSARLLTRQLVEALDALGFGHEDREVSGADTVALLAERLPALNAALGPSDGTASAVQKAARVFAEDLEWIGFGDEDNEVNGAEAVEAVARHLPALRAALSEPAQTEDYDAHLSQQEQEHYRQLEGEERDREDAYAGDEEDLGR